MPIQLRSTFTRLFAMVFGALLLTLTFSTSWAEDGWRTAKRIETNDYAGPPLIAADNLGNATAIWTQSDAAPQQYGVWTSRYTAGKGWGKPEHINDYIGQADHLTLAVNGKGNAIAVWAQFGLTDPNNPSAPFHSSLWSNRYDPAKGWGTPEQIQDASTYAINPKVSMDEQGNAIVVWHQQNATVDILNVYGKRYSKEKGWRATRLLQADATIQGSNPLIAMNDNGDAMIGWGQLDYTTYLSNSASVRYSIKAGWMAPETLPDGFGVSQLGIDGLGNAIAIGASMDPSTFQNNVFASRNNVRHGWSTPEMLQPGTDIDGGQLRLAMNGSGQAIALWKETTYTSDFSYEMRANRYVPGKGWKGSQLVGTTAINPDTGGSNPQIGMDGLGNAIAVWEQPNFAAQTDPYAQAPTNIQAFRFTVGDGWDTGTPIQKGTDQATNAQVSVTGNGRAFAVWQQQDMTTGATSLWANRFKP